MRSESILLNNIYIRTLYISSQVNIYVTKLISNPAI